MHTSQSERELCREGPYSAHLFCKAFNCGLGELQSTAYGAKSQIKQSSSVSDTREFGPTAQQQNKCAGMENGEGCGLQGENGGKPSWRHMCRKLDDRIHFFTLLSVNKDATV